MAAQAMLPVDDAPSTHGSNFIPYLLGSISPPRASFLDNFVTCKQAKLEAKLASWSVHFTRPTACTRDEYGFNQK